ncbi:MAG: asparagine synthase-related protein [Candidatus Hodarchaeota archaeon]
MLRIKQFALRHFLILGASMPGIVGIISKTPREKNVTDLDFMVECMIHEPFYTFGTYVDDELGLYAGWVCHRGSFSDCMPITNEKKDLVLLFSGENFTDKEVSEQLKRQGHEFDRSNASYLIHLYEEEGDGFLQLLNGWFSGILLDLRKAEAVLFNDRYGMHRIYYHENREAFFFSSEAKSLLRILPDLRKVDPKSLGEFFTCNCVMQNRTLFANVFLLPGGSAWVFQNGNRVKKGSYFKPDVWENQPILDREIFYGRLRNTFQNILPRYFYAKEPIAMSLTGGLDTRMILACRNNPPDSLPCYTFGGMYRDSFDVGVAQKVAAACHQTHTVLHVDKKFLSDFPHLAEKTIYITDGSLGLTGVPELYVNRLARGIAPIRMTGNYGGEVLRSVRAFKPNPPFDGLFHPDFKNHIQNAQKTFADLSGGHRLSFAVFKQAPWFHYGRLALEQSQLTLRSPYMDNDLVSLMYQAPVKATTTNETSLHLIADSNPDLSRIMTDRGVGGSSNCFFSICSRLYYEFLFKAEYYFDYGMPQWLAILNYKLAPFHLEGLFLGHHKFYHFRVWFREELSDYIRDILLEQRTVDRPYLNKGYLEEIVSRHTRGDRNYTSEINKILTTELIQRLLIENMYGFPWGFLKN